jgi:hypothetical protein
VLHGNGGCAAAHKPSAWFRKGRILWAIKNNEITIIPKRIYGNVNSGNKETIRLHMAEISADADRAGKVHIHQRAAVGRSHAL